MEHRQVRGLEIWQECLYRLRDIGMQRAYITGYSPEAIALYGSLGATDPLQSFVYEKAAP